MKKKILIVTSTRAEYGLLRGLIKQVNSSKKLNLILVVTGTHFTKKFGFTYKEILKDNSTIHYKVKPKLESVSQKDLVKSMGFIQNKFLNIFEKEKPDLLLILGDRYEILSVAIAAMIARVPIGHIHGGETTQSVIDEAIRHSITKMSHLHFVACYQYAKRVQQLGEKKSNIYSVGGLGIDSIKSHKLLNKKDIQNKLKFKLRTTNFLLTYHPVTLEPKTSKIHITEILSAISMFPDILFIVTLPNAEVESEVIMNMFIKNKMKLKNVIIFKSLGSLNYLSLMKHVNGVIGNSSSGIFEAPFLKKVTINIGNRQKGRIQSRSIINCIPKRDHIYKSINLALSNKFNKKLVNTPSIFGNGGASKKIVSILENKNLKNLLIKKFYDIN